MTYKLRFLRVFVIDWERALEFYSETLEMRIAFAASEMGWAELDTGEAHLALQRIEADDEEAAELVGRFVGVSLEVPDIQASYETLLARGTEFVAPPERQGWGGMLAHFQDPDGNILTLLGE